MISTRSEEDLRKARKCTELLFGKQGVITKEMIEDVLDELPMVQLEQKEKQWSVVEILVHLGLADSNSNVVFIPFICRSSKEINREWWSKSEWKSDQASPLCDPR